MARRRRAGRRRRGARNVRRGNRLRKLINGGMLRGRMHPPTNSASPWNNCVVTFKWSPSVPAKDKDGKNIGSFVTVQSLTATQVREQLVNELGLSGAVDIRITRIDVWTQPQISNSNRNCVVLAPVDWTRCGDAVINWYESWGTSVQPAHTHYVWPRSISNVVITNANACAIAKFDIIDANYVYIIKIHLTWRKTSPNPLRSVPGFTCSLRGSRTSEPPPSDNYVVVDHDCAISPLAYVVEACNLRS